MRWDRLFADLEGQYDAAAAAELAEEVADRSRREVALVRLADRLRAATGPLVLGLPSGPVSAAAVLRVGADWLLVTDGTYELLIPLDAVSWVRGLPVAATTERSAVAARLGLGAALRAVARDRAEVTLVLTDGSTLTGTVDRVGADFLDLAEHPLGEPRRGDAVQGVRAVAWTAITVVRRL